MQGMFYRILMAPPGYPPDQNYMVAEYTTLDFEWCCGDVKNTDGSRFFASIEEARKAIPRDARRLPFEPEHQFVELWESSVSGG
jgi:hypothetical protein